MIERPYGIVVDTAGGDFAPAAPIAGALSALTRYPAQLYLVGHPADLRPHLPQPLPEGLEVVPASEVVAMGEKEPASAVRTKPDSSMVVGMKLVREGRAQAFVSAGHTGAVMAAALLTLGRRPGIRRPALAVPFPTREGVCILLDVGANPDCRPEWLVQFAEMGSQVASRVLGIHNPRVGLLSNGEEESKGSELVLQAHRLLRRTALNFVGNVEGKDVPAGAVDVVVTDGFTGNVGLKLAEGVGLTVGAFLKEELRRSPITRLGALLALPALRSLGRKLDWSEYGGGLLVGVNGVVVIPHGRSNPNAILNSVRVAYEALQSDLMGSIGDIAAAEPARLS